MNDEVCDAEFVFVLAVILDADRRTLHCLKYALLHICLYTNKYKKSILAVIYVNIHRNSILAVHLFIYVNKTSFFRN